MYSSQRCERWQLTGRRGLAFFGILAIGLVIQTPSRAEVLEVPSTNGDGVLSSPLQAGIWHLIEASGTWSRDVAGHACDAEWYFDPTTGSWLEDYPGWPELLDLQIDGVSVNWLGTTDGCRFAPHRYNPSHVYRYWYLGTGAPIRLSILDDAYPGQNSGSLTVSITEADCADGESLTVPSTNGDGVWTQSLDSGKSYLIIALGTWSRDVAGHLCDAEWYYDPDSDQWLEEYASWLGLLDLQIDGVSPVWLGTPDGIDFAEHTFSPSHVYRLRYEGTGAPINLRIYDDYYPGENSGELLVTIVPDCNFNDIPDGCEPDCNGNGFPDDCDIAAGTSIDCDANGIPDDCDLPGDIDGDGDVDFDDLNLLLANYGRNVYCN